jgi:hypothetical protein
MMKNLLLAAVALGAFASPAFAGDWWELHRGGRYNNYASDQCQLATESPAAKFEQWTKFNRESGKNGPTIKEDGDTVTVDLNFPGGGAFVFYRTEKACLAVIASEQRKLDKYRSVLGGKTRGARVSSQWKSTP